MRQTREVCPERVERGVLWFKDQRWMFPSPPLEARFTDEGDTVEVGRVALGYQLIPPILSVWPRRTAFSSRSGTERSFMPPPQLPAARISPEGEKRVILIGLSPAIWVP